jgi:hypothetical protein
MTDKILKHVNETNPETVEALIEDIEQELGVPRDEALKFILNLENQGRLRLTQSLSNIPNNLQDYLFSTYATWFWIIMILSLTTVFFVVLIPERAYPYVYIRYIFGSIFILFFPGYTLVKTLFPIREINTLERTSLSIGTSLALVPIVGLLLNYTPWGIRLIPVTISILLLTAIFALSGLSREFQEIRR